MNSITKNCYICQFNKDNLKKVLKNDFISLEAIERKKRHFIYLLEYLGSGDRNESPGLDAGMILVEKKYTSRSYLEDYRDHYFISYSTYERNCERIHFFKHKLPEEIIDNPEEQNKLFNILLSHTKTSNQIWDGYLGHIVKRPIPTGLIGATLLKTYPTDIPTNGYFRKYTVRKNYKVNLFGRERILKTLIYVEQDSIVGACATSALYVAFHRLSHLFETKRPNQKKISNAAGISYMSPNRKLKNKEGLKPFQMCQVLEKFELDPEVYELGKRSIAEIKALLYAYLKMGIPIIFGFQFDSKEKVFLSDSKEKKKEKKNYHHAITLTGYAEPVPENVAIESYRTNIVSGLFKKEVPFHLKSKNIEQFYAHDDQIGPFARIKLDEETKKIITSWWDSEKGAKTKLNARPMISIIPLSNRITIPYEATRKNVELINIWLHSVLDGLDFIHWDIYLSRSNKEKKYILEGSDYDYSLHSDTLSETYPKYVWVADCYVSKNKVFKIIFDASEIKHEHFGKDIVYFSHWFKDILVKYFADLEKVSQNILDVKYYKQIVDTTGIETTNLFRKSLNLDIIKI